MRYFRYLIAVMAVALCAGIKAQTLSVESFRLLENDLTANTYGTMMRDQNGEVAALIRVVTSEKGFVFDGGMMGIVGTKQDVGEILLYVPHGIQKITIKHDQLGIIRDWYFPIPIEKARTYEMKLLSGRVRTVIEDEVSAQFVIFHVEPNNATVTIDGKANLPDREGNVSQLLSYGSHDYRVELPGYKTEAGTVQVGSEKVNLNVTLQSSKATITLTCPMAEADIYLNEQLVGQGSWTGELAAAMYMVEVRREGYQTRSTAITVEEFEERTIMLPEPLPQYGHVQIQSTPLGATIILDGEEIGRTPHLQRDVRVGTHAVLVKAEGYNDYQTTILVENSKVAQLNVSLVSDNLAARKREVSEPSRETARTATVTKTEEERLKELRDNAPLTKKQHVRKNCLYIGGFYVPGQMASLVGLVGFYAGNFNVEGEYGVMNHEIEGYWVSSSSERVSETYVYPYVWRFTSTWTANLGYGIKMGRSVRLTPQVGMYVYNLESKEDMLFKATRGSYTAGGIASAKLEIVPARHFSIFLKPRYAYPFRHGQIATELENNENSITRNTRGFSVSIGAKIIF